MMRQPTNNLRIVLVSLCGAVLLIPGVAFARTSPGAHQNSYRAGTDQSAAAAGAGNFCSSIDVLSTKIMKDITQSETRFAAKETEKQNTLTDTLAKRDATRLEARSTWDSSHDEIFANLMARASSTDETQAVEKFQSDIDTAVATRRKSIDDALTTFRTGVDGALKGRKSGVEDAIKIFRATTDTALIDAKANCASGTASTKVRQGYVADLLAGKQTFLDAVQGAQKTDDTMKKLVKDRDASVDGANAAFKKALNQAEADLMKIFPGA